MWGRWETEPWWCRWGSSSCPRTRSCFHGRVRHSWAQSSPRDLMPHGAIGIPKLLLSSAKTLLSFFTFPFLKPNQATLSIGMMSWTNYIDSEWNRSIGGQHMRTTSRILTLSPLQNQRCNDRYAPTQEWWMMCWAEDLNEKIMWWEGNENNQGKAFCVECFEKSSLFENDQGGIVQKKKRNEFYCMVFNTYQRFNKNFDR